MSFGPALVHYVYALVVIALLLLAMTWVVGALGRGRLLASTRHRLTSVVESTYLTQQSTLHVVKAAGKYYLVGGGSAGVTLICELPAEEVNEWIETQRRLAGEQTQGLKNVWTGILRFRR